MSHSSFKAQNISVKLYVVSLTTSVTLLEGFILTRNETCHFPSNSNHRTLQPDKPPIIAQYEYESVDCHLNFND